MFGMEILSLTSGNVYQVIGKYSDDQNMYSKMRNHLYSLHKDLVKQSIATFTPWKCLNWKGNKPRYEERSSLIGRFLNCIQVNLNVFFPSYQYFSQFATIKYRLL